jgi:hypothetical protein
MLTIAAWGQRLVGAFLVGPLLDKRPILARAAGLIPAAVVMAVIVQLTVARGSSLVVDERLAGMTVAAFLVWRRAPFIVVVLGAAIVTAGLRALVG